MVHLSFIEPANLWFSLALPSLILIHFITLRYTRQKALRFANYEAIERISGGVVVTKNITLLVMRFIALTCVILAVSGTILHYTGYGTDQKFVLAIDASSSMTTKDMPPTRLAVAKGAAKVFVDEVGSKTRTGVLSFAGSSLIHQAITGTVSNVKSAIDQIRILAIGGTDMGEAIVTGVNLFQAEGLEGGKAIILLTDGRSNVGIAVDKAILYANEANIAIHTIGVGTPEGGLLTGTNVTITLDEPGLQKISDKTGGNYYRAETEEQLIQAYKEIAQIGKTKVSVRLSTSLLMIALTLLIIEWALINTKYRTLP